MSIIRKAAVYILLTSVYGITYLMALLGSIIPRRSWKPTGRVLVTGAFYNTGWYLSHMTPLSRCGMKMVILVTDEPQLPLERVKVVCPPSWALRLLGRIGARTVWMIIASLRYRPDLYMGYHLAPGACSALVAGKLLGRPSCYQMTGGPIGIIGGGFAAIDSIEGVLGHPSKLIETMALAIVKLFDLIVVRGNKTKEYLEAQDIKGAIAIITGSIKGRLKSTHANRGIDLIFVGRLVPVKQVDQFITIVEAVSRVTPSVRAAIVGDGPLMKDLRAYVNRLGLTDNIKFLSKRKDVEEILLCSKIFVLTSKSEGMSIAMAEAMAAGVVPVVADVGELGDLVIDGVNGYLIEPNHIDEYTKRIISLLQDQALWRKHSLRAIEDAKKYCDIEVVTGKWRRNLQDVVSQASGHCMQEVMN
jgi:glycosyltransferase involved in cell wall biosynthesis